MSTVSLDDVSKVFDDGTVAVQNLSLEVTSGELMVLLGPSGCGKSTVLRMIAGLEPLSSGRILLGGEDTEEVPARNRGVSMVFQDFALYPHMSVRENLGFPLKIQRRPPTEIEDRVAGMAHQLGIADLLDRRPGKLSGGQRQRVAMGRAIIRQPSVFLMDEPLSNVDSMLRSELRAEISDMVRSIGVTTIYVTHDQVEALTMADRVAIMRGGVLQDLGTPDQIYNQPGTIYVAAFLGAPRINLLSAYVQVYLESRVALHLSRTPGSQVLSLPWSDPRCRMLARYHGDRVVLGIRAEALAPAHRTAGFPGHSGEGLTGQVRFVEHLGHESICYLDVGGESVAVDDVVDDGRHHYTRADLAVRLPAYPGVTPGGQFTVRADLEQAHFFDPKGPRIDFRRH
ncbi:MAG TPA: ABC transporter ATP-binding protein [Micromonosporaceae bacterium]|nr:ABC transporter ATP-binding protein [Micromonosporaceae bacterium]